MRRVFTKLLTPGLVLLLACGPAAAATEEIDASPGERLVVDLKTGGKLSIRGWDRDVVSVDATFTGRDADAVVFEVRRIGGGVEVTSRFKEKRSRTSTGGTIKIRVPRRFDLRLESMGGRIEIEDVEGELRGQTMGGELDLRRLAGSVELTTMGGNVALSDSEVDGKLQTYGGNVRIARVLGNVEGETMGGEVTYVDVQAAGSTSKVKIRTMGGNINAPDAPNGADLETMGGDISIGYAGEFLRVKTMGGDISADAVDGWVRATTMGGRIRVVMVGDPRTGRRDVRLISMGGDIRLTVPQGLSMDVDITLAYTKNSKQRYEIKSDFPLQIGETPDWQYGSGTPRKNIYGTGTIDGGEHKIKIETINGNVELLRGE